MPIRVAASALLPIALVALICLTGAVARAADAPIVPCVGAKPTFPPLGAEPMVRIVHGDELGVWAPPLCTGWPAGKVDLLGVTTARFRHAGDINGLVHQFGDVSMYTTMRYWSPSRMKWWPLSFEAFALNDNNRGHRRADFTIDEFMPGKPLYFWQRAATEVRIPLLTTVELVNRIDVLELSPDRLVVNVTSEPTSFALVWTLHRGDRKSVV